MALPTNLAAKIKSIPMDPTILAANPELAYILSFSNHSTSIPTQLSLTTPSISILGTLFNLPWNTSNLLILRMIHTSNSKKTPPRTSNTKTNK